MASKNTTKSVKAKRGLFFASTREFDKAFYNANWNIERIIHHWNGWLTHEMPWGEGMATLTGPRCAWEKREVA